MRTQLEQALDCVLQVYHRYAARSPDHEHLSREEFSALLRDTAQPFLRNTAPPNASPESYIEELFSKADANGDGRLKFSEFLSTLSLAANEAHERSHRGAGGHRGAGDKHGAGDNHGDKHGDKHGHGGDHGHGDNHGHRH